MLKLKVFLKQKTVKTIIRPFHFVHCHLHPNCHPNHHNYNHHHHENYMGLYCWYQTLPVLTSPLGKILPFSNPPLHCTNLHTSHVTKMFL